MSGREGDRKVEESCWRHLDLGVWRLEVPAAAPADLSDPGRARGGVPFARHASGFARDFEQLVAWLATRTDMTTAEMA